MNRKSSILCFICFMLALNLFAQGQEPKKNIIGFGAGFSPEFDYDIWIGNPVSSWLTKNASPVFQFFYARQVREAFRLGGYFEYENAT